MNGALHLNSTKAAVSKMADMCNRTDVSQASLRCQNITRLSALNDELAFRLLPVVVYLGIIAFVGVFGNVLVIYVYNFRFKWSSSNFFILCLASLDLLTCIFSCPVEIYDLVNPLMFDRPVVCKTMRCLTFMAAAASVATLLTVAYDRYRKVFSPFKHMSKKQTKVMSGVAVCMGILIGLPAFFVYGPKQVGTKDPEVAGVSCSHLSAPIFSKIYSAFNLFLFFVSVGILVVVYTKIGLEIWKRGKMCHNLSTTAVTSRDVKETSINTDNTTLGLDNGDTTSATDIIRKDSTEILSTDKPSQRHSPDPKITQASRPGYNSGKTTRILFYVSVAFILSFLPHVAVRIAESVIKKIDESNNEPVLLAYNFASRSFLINAAINPIIYGCMNVAFRAECKTLPQRCFKAAKHG